MPTETSFVSSALYGILTSLLFAFLVLLISTHNIIQSLISILCVSIIMMSVVAIISLCGWEFGVSESIGVVLLIGFAVDYVIHLSSDYMHSPLKSRHDKME
jgi:protein dispatched 1